MFIRKIIPAYDSLIVIPVEYAVIVTTGNAKEERNDEKRLKNCILNAKRWGNHLYIYICVCMHIHIILFVCIIYVHF